MTTYDLLVTNVRVVRPDVAETETLDIAAKDGKFARVEAGLDPSEADRVVDAGGRLAFPGVVDVHQHWGIYNDLTEDAGSESRAAVQGGVTSGITYIRTGQYYMNRTGPYSEV
ncbi:MAG: hydantoinase, partial [Mycobacteriaceae bacterium]